MRFEVGCQYTPCGLQERRWHAAGWLPRGHCPLTTCCLPCHCLRPSATLQPTMFSDVLGHIGATEAGMWMLLELQEEQCTTDYLTGTIRSVGGCVPARLLVCLAP